MVCRDWTRLILSDDNYLFANDVTEGQVIFYLTDMIQLYSQRLTAEEFSDKMQEFNPDLEDMVCKDMCAEIRRAISQLNTHQGILSRRNITESSIDISLNWENDGIPMAWSLSFSLDSAKELFEVFTSQTVSIIDLLLDQRAQLLKVIQEKEIEVEEYRRNNIKIRPHLRTQTFDRAEFLDRTSSKFARPALEVLQSTETVQLLTKVKFPNESSDANKDVYEDKSGTDSVDSKQQQQQPNQQQQQQLQRQPIENGEEGTAKRKTAPAPKVVLNSKRKKLNPKLQKL